MTSLIGAASAISFDPDGVVEWEKDPDTNRLAYSTSKVLSMYLGREYITDAMLDDTITIGTEGDSGGSTAQLEPGDVISFRDLFYGAMLPSGNDAAQAIAKWYVTQVYGSYHSSLYQQLAGNFARGTLGWTVTNSQMGGPENGINTTARQMAMLSRHVLQNDPWLIGVMGTLTREMTVTGGPNPRTINVSHTIDPVARDLEPEFVGGKTGSGGFGGSDPGSLVLYWDDPNGGTHTTVIMAGTVDGRYVDARTIMTDVIGEPPPPPDPVAAGRYMVRGGVLVAASGFVVSDGELLPLS